MANLLPIPQQRAVLADHELRFAAVAAAALFGLGLLACAVVIPSYLLAMMASVPAGPLGATASANAGVSNPQADLARAQALLSQLAPFAASSTPSATIATALELRPRGVRVRSIMYTAGSPSQLVLGGSADTATAIDSYRSLLRAGGPFTSVSVPVTALVGTTRGEFTATLSGTF